MRAKITSQLQIIAKMKEMTFAEKCQIRLDHETSRYLAKRGKTMNPQLYNRKRIPGLPELLGYTKTWIGFFLHQSLKVWDEFLSRKSYRWWIENRLFSKQPHFATDGWWRKK